MARIIMLKTFVNERLTAAAEEIFGIFERTIIQYEEEIDRQRKLVDLVLKPDRNLGRSDHLQLLVCEEEEQQQHQQRSLSLHQEDPEPLQFKEEHDDLWTSQGGEQLDKLEEADIIKLPFIPVHERRENAEDKSQSIQTQIDKDREGDPLPGTSTEQMKTEPPIEPDSYFDQGSYLPRISTEQIKTEPEGEDFSNYGQFLSSDCYRTETEDLDAWKETREPGSNRWRSKKMQKVKGESFQISVESPPELKSMNQTAVSHCCKVCRKSFTNKRSFFNHVKIHPHNCGLCGKHLEPTESLKLHIHAHQKCSICGKDFSSLAGLERHERIHTGERSFSCTVCGKGFNRYHHLENHMRTHTGEKPFRCTICGKGLGRNEQLQNHMRIHTGEKPFSCPVCGKRFNEKGTVKIHMRIHTGAKPYSCGLCGKRFRHSSRIGKHRCHTGE